MAHKEVLGAEAFQEWEAHPVTQALQEGCRREVQRVKDNWARGTYSNLNAQETVILQAGILGAIDKLNSIAQMEYSDFKELVKDEE